MADALHKCTLTLSPLFFCSLLSERKHALCFGILLWRTSDKKASGACNNVNANDYTARVCGGKYLFSAHPQSSLNEIHCCLADKQIKKIQFKLNLRLYIILTNTRAATDVRVCAYEIDMDYSMFKTLKPRNSAQTYIRSTIIFLFFFFFGAVVVSWLAVAANSVAHATQDEQKNS